MTPLKPQTIFRFYHNNMSSQYFCLFFFLAETTVVTPTSGWSNKIQIKYWIKLHCSFNYCDMRRHHTFCICSTWECNDSQVDVDKTSIDEKVLDWCLINVDLSVFVIWDSLYQNLPWLFRDHSACCFSQWETALHCNVVSQWLSPYPELSLSLSNRQAPSYRFRNIAPWVLI